MKYKVKALNVEELKLEISKAKDQQKTLKLYPCRKSGSTFVAEYWKVQISPHVGLNPLRCIGGSVLVRKIEDNPNEFRIGLIRNPFGLLRSYACHSHGGVERCTRGKDLHKIPELVMSNFESYGKEGRDSEFIKVFQEDNPYNDMHTEDGRLRVHVLIKTELLTKLTEEVIRPLDLFVETSKESNKWTGKTKTKRKNAFFRDFTTQEIKPVNTMEDSSGIYRSASPSFKEFFFSEDQSPWTEKLYTKWKPWFDRFHYDKEGNSTSDAVAFVIYEQ